MIMQNADLLEGYLKFHGYHNVVGEYWYTTNNTVVFYFNEGLRWTIETRIAEVMVAPNTSHEGSRNEGALPWLYLQPIPKSSQNHKVSAIYRYYTAGGKPKSHCYQEGAPFRVPYTAQFWIYERADGLKQTFRDL